VGFVVEKMALGQVFPGVLQFSFHSTGAPLLGKIKSSLSLGCTISLKAAVRP
jgi:hypothetical protein